MSRPPKVLRGRAEHDRRPVWDSPRGRRNAQFGRDGREVPPLRYRLVADQQVAPALCKVRLARRKDAICCVADVDQRQSIRPRADKHHPARFDHRCDASEARDVARSVDPAGADDRHRRAFFLDQPLKQPFTGDLRSAVRIGLSPQRRALISISPHVVAVHGDGADMNDSTHAR